MLPITISQQHARTKLHQEHPKTLTTETQEATRVIPRFNNHHSRTTATHRKGRRQTQYARPDTIVGSGTHTGIETVACTLQESFPPYSTIDTLSDLQAAGNSATKCSRQHSTGVTSIWRGSAPAQLRPGSQRRACPVYKTRHRIVSASRASHRHLFTESWQSQTRQSCVSPHFQTTQHHGHALNWKILGQGHSWMLSVAVHQQNPR